MFKTSNSLKKIFSITLLTSFCIAVVAIGLTQIQSKNASAFEWDKFWAKCLNNSSRSYNYYDETKCDLAQTAAVCTIDSCSNGIDPDHGYYNVSNNLNSNNYYNYNYDNCSYSYNSCSYNYNNGYYVDDYNWQAPTPVYDSWNYYNTNYNQEQSCRNTDCLDMAIYELTSQLNGDQTSAYISSELGSRIANSNTNLGSIPTSVVSNVENHGNRNMLNTVTTEVKNQNGDTIATGKFTFDNSGKITNVFKSPKYSGNMYQVGSVEFVPSCSVSKNQSPDINYSSYNNSNYIISEITCKSNLSMNIKGKTLNVPTYTKVTNDTY